MAAGASRLQNLRLELEPWVGAGACQVAGTGDVVRSRGRTIEFTCGDPDRTIQCDFEGAEPLDTSVGQVCRTKRLPLQPGRSVTIEGVPANAVIEWLDTFWNKPPVVVASRPGALPQVTVNLMSTRALRVRRGVPGFGLAASAAWRDTRILSDEHPLPAGDEGRTANRGIGRFSVPDQSLVAVDANVKLRPVRAERGDSKPPPPRLIRRKSKPFSWGLDHSERAALAADGVDRDLMTWIRDLHKQYKIGLLSNAWDNLRGLLVDRWQVAGEFDDLVISAEVGLVKPDRRIYELGDGQWNIPGLHSSSQPSCSVPQAVWIPCLAYRRIYRKPRHLSRS